MSHARLMNITVPSNDAIYKTGNIRKKYKGMQTDQHRFMTYKTYNSMNRLLTGCQNGSYLFAIVSWVVPCSYSIVVIHKEWPPSLWINFNFPTRRKRVVCGHCNHWRLRLHAMRNPRSWILSHSNNSADALKNQSSDVEKEGLAFQNELDENRSSWGEGKVLEACSPCTVSLFKIV